MTPLAHITVGQFSFVADVAGAHVDVKVRIGEPGSRALLGTLTMSPEDWAAWCELLGDAEHAAAIRDA